MEQERPVDRVDNDVATAFGLYALSEARVHEAAAEAGVTRWELEDAIERAGLADVFGIDEDTEVSATIDELLDQ
jgi:hypothetical protein